MHIDAHRAVVQDRLPAPAVRDGRAGRGAAPMKIIGFVGDSGSGKTTLVEQLIARFARGGLRVCAIKHAHHGFDIDRPGKDSYRFRVAGAAQVLVAAQERWVLMSEEPETDPAQALARHIARLDPCDLVIVEGYRGQAGIDFIEVRRSAAGPASERAGATLAPRPPPAGRVAIACVIAPEPGSVEGAPDLLDLNDVEGIARYIAGRLELPL